MHPVFKSLTRIRPIRLPVTRVVTLRIARYNESLSSSKVVEGGADAAVFSPTETLPDQAMGRGGKRSWHSGDRREAKRNRRNAVYNGEGRPADLVVGEKKPKRKVACLVGYCGTGYHGMQLNPPNKTIEGDLFEAFVKVGAVSSYNADDPKKVALARAARTDKGVHAAGNVITLKLILEDENLIQKVNEVLPPTIRVWDVIRTINSFNPRTYCESRIYEYLLPSYAFAPPKPTSNLGKLIIDNAVSKGDKLPEGDAAEEDIDNLSRRLFFEEGKQLWDEFDKTLSKLKDDFNADPASFKDPYRESLNEADALYDIPQDTKLSRVLKHAEIHELRKYRITPERLRVAREAFKRFDGVHNFHNFTVGQSFHDRSSNRVIKSFTVSDPIIIEGTEWLSLKVHGQSFMLHQIRKMVALIMLVVRTGCPLGRIGETFRKPRVNIPRGPGLGLLLESPFFQGYNEHKAAENNRPPIDFTKYDETIEAFKKEYIYSHIFKEEAASQVFHGFLTFIDSYIGDTFAYLSDRGIETADKTEAEELPKLPKEISSEDEDDEQAAAGNKAELEG